MFRLELNINCKFKLLLTLNIFFELHNYAHLDFLNLESSLLIFGFWALVASTARNSRRHGPLANSWQSSRQRGRCLGGLTRSSHRGKASKHIAGMANSPQKVDSPPGIVASSVKAAKRQHSTGQNEP